MDVSHGNGATGKNGVAPVKSHVCKHDGCGKRFSRLEHLNRHALNHQEGHSVCPRCQVPFKRPDLLARHMERHRKRDEESGGTAALNTRKRRYDNSSTGQRSQQLLVEHDNRLLTADSEGPISPPLSLQSSDVPSSLHGQESYQQLDFGYPKDASVAFPDLSFESTNFQLADNFGDDFYGPAFMPAYNGAQASIGMPYDEAFQSDTASSFNMPYTTATNYNWLFDLNSNLAINDGGVNQAQAQPQRQMISHDMIAHSHSSRQASFDNAGALSQSPEGTGEEHKASAASPSPINPSPGSLDPERPLGRLYPTTALPCIDDSTRRELLGLIESLRPISPAGEPVTRASNLLSLSSLQTYLDLFFTRFNTAYPLVHQPTFVASTAEPIYLLAILLLGATYSAKDAHQLAVCIHDVMRPGIFAHAAFSAEPQLWILKTILLVECFGKSRAGQKQHNMSHLFHGLLINLIRRSDCQAVQPIGPKEADAGEDLEAAWLRWAEAEEKKRLALLCFLWDTQHAVLFCQSLCMSSFEIRVSLPCAQTLWEARTASEWKSCGTTSAPEPPFLTSLKSFLTMSSPRPPYLNSLSRILILHGLMSIQWDMQRRDQTSLGVLPTLPKGGSGTWRDRIARAYDLWKADFDAHCSALSAAHHEREGAEDMRKELAVFSTGYNAVYHAAQVLLNTDFLDLQIYAGARHILGRPVQRSDFVRSERVVKQWADVDGNRPISGSSAKAAWHAATLLVDASRDLDDFDALGLFHVPWCLYLATLTCWAFHHAGKKGDVTGTSASSEIVWDARAEMDALISEMAESGNPWELVVKQGRDRTGGLVWVMANALERVRWGIIHSGVMVLRGLVPWRLINQYG